MDRSNDNQSPTTPSTSSPRRQLGAGILLLVVIGGALGIMWPHLRATPVATGVMIARQKMVAFRDTILKAEAGFDSLDQAKIEAGDVEARRTMLLVVNDVTQIASRVLQEATPYLDNDIKAPLLAARVQLDSVEAKMISLGKTKYAEQEMIGTITKYLELSMAFRTAVQQRIDQQIQRLGSE